MQGKQLKLTGMDCNVDKINNKKIVRNFLKTLVDKIEMRRLSKVYVYRAVPEEPDGVTGFVVITTSHISIHTFVDKNLFWLDILSCKEFDEKKVIEFVKEKFEVNKTFIELTKR